MIDVVFVELSTLSISRWIFSSVMGRSPFG